MPHTDHTLKFTRGFLFALQGIYAFIQIGWTSYHREQAACTRAYTHAHTHTHTHTHTHAHTHTQTNGHTHMHTQIKCGPQIFGLQPPPRPSQHPLPGPHPQQNTFQGAAAQGVHQPTKGPEKQPAELQVGVGVMPGIASQPRPPAGPPVMPLLKRRCVGNAAVCVCVCVCVWMCVCLCVCVLFGKTFSTYAKNCHKESLLISA